MCIYVCAARAQVANHSSKQCADNGLTNAKVIYLVSFQRVLVSWARQETTVTLTVAPVAGSCPLWHRPADRMIASGPIPLSAAGANWYWWCSVPFSNSRHKKAAWLNVFSERLQGRGLVNAIGSILFSDVCLHYFQTDSEARFGMRSGMLNAVDDGDSKRAKLSSTNRGIYSRMASSSVTGSTYSSNGLSSGRGTL